MLITVERHDEFEEILQARGLFKEASTHMGTIRLYTIDNKTVVTYTSDGTETNYVFVQKKSTDSEEKDESSSKKAHPLSIHLSKQILDPILRETHTPKDYKVKKSILHNGEIEVSLIHIESGDIKVLSAVEGLDHAIDVFDDIPVEVKQTHFCALEETLIHIFMSALLA